jgi:uncharacterized protein YxjI
MREKMFSIGDDYWIEDDNGNRKYKVDGKSLRIRQTFILENSAGQELAKICEKKLSIRDAMRIERNGDTVATIRKALVSPLRDKYKIELESGGELIAKGKIGEHNYKIERDGNKVAEVSKKWFKVRDTYGIEIDDKEDDVLILAAAVCLEEMSQGVVD